MKLQTAIIVAVAIIGILILVSPAILVAIGVSAALPAATRGVNEQEAGMYWEGAEIAITSYHTAADSITLTVKNNKNFPAKITAITLTGKSGETAGLTAQPQSPIQPSSTAQLVVQVKCPAGASFSYKATIDYDDEEGTKYKFVGIVPLVGTCK